MKLLLVEDERDLNQSLTKLLKKNQFSVDSAFDGQEALDYLAVGDYDVIILDVMMPRMDGFQFIQRLRQDNHKVAVLMLTARDALEDRIKGLDLGADDYVIKPFEFEELLARIRAMLRRRYRPSADNCLKLGRITLDMSKKLVLKEGEIIDLTAKEYEVLEYLARNQNQVLSREKIRNHVWDFDYEGESNIIDVLIKNIRRKIGDSRQDSLIQTKRGLGYVIWQKDVHLED
ncbi:response regulator transcription factor [Streptococcus ratti]|uniref:Response regulator transcription factor n=1 Tax=Streptococcus ratti TaxID=1341 RepID=A0A7X9LE10_STRRT|nr:response regulator transcription factor [Streptococcus ratti]NMD49528.1 response regulator transcription factor [Streptococcus ratti]